MTRKDRKRITKFRVETERTYVFRSRNAAWFAWCARCGLATEMATVAGASDVSGLSEMDIYSLVESGAIHFAEDSERRVRVCLNSVTKGKDLLKKEINP